MNEPLSKGRPKTVDDTLRREHIIDCADHLFRNHGFMGTTTSMIAAEAMISKRSLYEFFTNKQDIYIAVIEKNRQWIVDLPRPDDEDLPLMDALIRIFRLDLDADADRDREQFLRLLLNDSVELPDISEYLYDNGIISAREQLSQWLLHEAAQGKLEIDDSIACAGMLMSIVFGALVPRRRNEDITLRKQHIRTSLAIFIKGVGGR